MNFSDEHLKHSLRVFLNHTERMLLESSLYSALLQVFQNRTSIFSHCGVTNNSEEASWPGSFNSLPIFPQVDPELLPTPQEVFAK